jgi:hypothetical protein
MVIEPVSLIFLSVPVNGSAITGATSKPNETTQSSKLAERFMIPPTA